MNAPRTIDLSHNPDQLGAHAHACGLPIDAADTITGEATRALRPAYNEVTIGAQRVDADRITVAFHACRGVETDRGVRMVDLVRSFIGPRDAVWKLESVQVMKVAGELQSRRGHVSSV